MMRHLTIFASVFFIISSPSFAQQDKPQSGYVWANNQQCKVWDDAIRPLDRMEWQGPCQNGFGEGQGTLTSYAYSNDKEFRDVFVGTLKAGKLNGTVKMTLANGLVYEGDIADGVIKGTGFLTFANGDTYQGQFDNNAQHGQGTFTWKNGSTYVGGYKNGKLHGFGRYTIPNVGYFEGTYADGFANGKGLEVNNAPGKEYRYEGDFSKGQKTGMASLTYSNGDRYVGRMSRGRRDGFGIYYFKNGDRLEAIWRYQSKAPVSVATLYYHDGDRFVARYAGAGLVGAGKTFTSHTGYRTRNRRAAPDISWNYEILSFNNQKNLNNVPAAYRPWPPSDFEQVMKKSIDILNIKNYPNARREIDKALSLERNNVQMAMLRAQILQNQRKWNDAYTWWKEAQRLSGLDESYFAYELAKTLYERERGKAAASRNFAASERLASISKTSRFYNDAPSISSLKSSIRTAKRDVEKEKLKQRVRNFSFPSYSCGSPPIVYSSDSSSTVNRKNRERDNWRTCLRAAHSNQNTALMNFIKNDLKGKWEPYIDNNGKSKVTWDSGICWCNDLVRPLFKVRNDRQNYINKLLADENERVKRWNREQGRN